MAEDTVSDLKKAFPAATQEFSTPADPLFNGETPLMRALICVGLGCDVYPKGMPSCGPSKIHQALQGLSHIPNLEERADGLSVFFAT